MMVHRKVKIVLNNSVGLHMKRTGGNLVSVGMRSLRCQNVSNSVTWKRKFS